MHSHTPDTSSFLGQLLVLRKRWRLIVSSVVLVAATAAVVSSLQSAEYTATSSLLFRDTQFDQQLYGSNFTPQSYDPVQQQATNLDLVELPTVATRTARVLHIPTSVVRSETAISPAGQANIVMISVTDRSPARAAAIANTYATQFVLFRQSADRSKIVGAQELVRQQLAALPPQQRTSSVGQALENRASELGVLAALQTGNAEVVQRASAPATPSSPQPKRDGILGLLVGLLLGVAFSLLAERLDRRIHDASELEQIFEVPLLGTVPESQEYVDAGTKALPPRETEAFALLRARLRYFNVDREIRSILLTSAVPGEGKTTVALSLALAEAAVGHTKVVLLEADLRRPALARRLQIEPTPGLAEVLSRSASLDDAISTVPVPRTGVENGARLKLTVLTAGAVPPNPAELLESRAMVDLLTKLAERFDFVVVDTPPTEIVPDAVPLTRLVSGVIVVTRMETATRDAARHLRDQLAKLQAPLLGVVANAVPPKAQSYYYSHGYYEQPVAAVPPLRLATGKPGASTEASARRPVR